MIQKVIKYGNSLAVILPKEDAAAIGVEAGTLVQASVEGGRLVVAPVEVVPKLSPKNQRFVDQLYKRRRKVFEALGE